MNSTTNVSTHIRTYDDLCAEKEKMKNQLVLQKQRVADSWDGLKGEFGGVNKMLGVVGKMTKGNKSNPLMSAGLKAASDLFIKNFVLAKAGWLTRFAVPFILRNYSSHLIAGNGKNILGKVSSLFRRKNTVNGSSPYSTSRPATSSGSVSAIRPSVTPSTTAGPEGLAAMHRTNGPAPVTTTGPTTV